MRTRDRAGARGAGSSAAGLRGEIILPGDKSISHRAAILSALSDGEAKVTIAGRTIVTSWTPPAMRMGTVPAGEGNLLITLMAGCLLDRVLRAGADRGRCER